MSGNNNKLNPVAAYLKCRKARWITVEPALLLFLLGRQFFLSLLQQYFFVALARKYLQENEEDDSLHSNSSGIVPHCLRSSTLSNHSTEVYREVLSESNALVAYSQAANSPAPILLTLLLMPFLDRHGYRLGLVLPVCGNIAKGFLMLMIVYFSIDPRWIPAVSFLCSLTGEMVLFVSTSFVYISQVSERKWVTTRIALGEAAACFGEATGMFLSGFFLTVSDCDYIVLLLFFIAVNALAIVYIVLFLPEALSKNERILNFEERKFCDVFSELRQMFTASFSKSWRLSILLVYISVSFIMPYGNSLIMLYFLKALPFDFSELRIGIVQSAIAYGRSMYNVLLAILSCIVEIPDLGIVLVALLVSSASSVVYGLAKVDWEIYTGKGEYLLILLNSQILFSLFYTVSIFYGMDVLGWAGAEAYMSKLLGQKEQGIYFTG